MSRVGGSAVIQALQFRGHEELEARIAEAYAQFVGSGKYSVTSARDMTAHQNVAMFTIQLVCEPDEVAWAARVFLVLGEDGLIWEDYHLTVKPLATQ